MREKFRMRPRKYSFIAPFLFAVAEKTHNFEKSPETYKSHWEGPVLELPKREDKRRTIKKRKFSDVQNCNDQVQDSSFHN